ncbi:MAG: malate synthase A [Rhizobiales bacterium]|nr:malate synthase A [Hyphomicrobiales bacterium]
MVKKAETATNRRKIKAARTRRRTKAAASRKGAAASAAKPKRAPKSRPPKGPKGVSGRNTGRTGAKPASSKGRRRLIPRASAPARKPAVRKPKSKPSILEKTLTSALASVGRTVQRAGKGVGRVLPSKPAGRPKALRGRAPSRRPGSTEARRAPGVRRPAAVPGVTIRAPVGPRYADVLTTEALAFLAELHRWFDGRRRELLTARAAQKQRYDAGELPDFRADTQAIRDGDWRVAPIPPDLTDRRVEITGPVDRKMIINALNSGANVFMADFEDANSPTWTNNLDGQVNLKERWTGTLSFTDPDTGRDYQLGPNPAVLIVRPRGWHLLEEHLAVDGQAVSGALFDFGLYAFHNAQATLAQGSGPYFYLPKLETHLEARLWNEVFAFTEETLGLPAGAIKATVLIETLPAAFVMDEILWEMRERIIGLNAGRWDYIFSFIKTFAKNPDDILPDRSQVVMGKAFLGAYAALLVKTCHHRGAFAMGGMAAQIPVRHDPQANEAAFAKVREDKEREVRDGCDGTWVAHPDLVPVAREVFDRLMPEPNQLDRVREDLHVTRDDLLRIHDGIKTEQGFRHNIRVGVQYIEAWLRGRGAVPIYNLMEDAATAEISRAQIWQWIRYLAVLDTGVVATPEFFERALAEEMRQVEREIGRGAYAKGRFPEAITLFRDLSLAEDFADFLTTRAYRLII